MRFKTQKSEEPVHGSERIISFFAFWPVGVWDEEARWLERVTIRQKYDLMDMNADAMSGRITWRNVQFVD